MVILQPVLSAHFAVSRTLRELQISRPFSRGNSGGPLLDANGLVIGVVQAKLDAIRAAITTGDIPQNVNFAISLDVLAKFLAKNKVAFRKVLSLHRWIQRGWLS